MAAGAASLISAPGAARSNHLKGSSSPYLQRASQEPVDWYPWGEEADLYQKYKGRVQFVVIDLDIKWTAQQQELVKSYYRGYIPHVTVLDALGNQSTTQWAKSRSLLLHSGCVAERHALALSK